MQDRLKTLNPEEITPQAALIFVDNALYNTEGRRLNDLESRIFLGSWEGKTYEEIHPLNPEYVEKSVGYKLWKKLSIALGEKVSKKRIRGAVMRHYRGTDSLLSAKDWAKEAKCVTIWQGQSPSSDPLLMQTLKGCFESLGYQVHFNVSEHSSAKLSLSPLNNLTWAEVHYDDVLVITVSDREAATNEVAIAGN
ncbi:MULTISPECIES: hypothetical protein [Cyanophyceae]|uniref:vWA-MoxR associated protein N-terminal HTH domain-containing protein n=1 Tax=Leptolyngbya subtilissima DQ-A4 TaxID=2933933 RepID=A0ABV0K754_9CYAN|nr:hypothetical protein [Nodosilinea sp. FACHB-141]MBD2114669.1 hypothetical protein [Nodosilinea sp. FACHB-141]